MRVGFIFFLAAIFSCHSDKVKPPVAFIYSQPRVILIQPLGKFDNGVLQKTAAKLKSFHNGFKVLKPISHFPSSYNKHKDRYRADTILNILKTKYGKDTLVLAMTHSDISVTKGKIKDWGVMGLAHCPGKVCVASTYRLDKKNLAEQLFKVSIHELAHTQGLPHCLDTTCYLRDAEGKRPLDTETGFCKRCRTHLLARGWTFQKSNSQ